MQIEYGQGGWVRVSDASAPGFLLYLRFLSQNGRPVLTELYLDGRGQEITGAHVRSIDVAGLTTATWSGEGAWLASSVKMRGPDLSVLASHFGVHFFGERVRHWVAQAWRNNPKAPRGKDPRPHASQEEMPTVGNPMGGPLTDDFLRQVATVYAAAVARRLRPAPTIAQQTGVSSRTVHAWIRKARERGIMPPTRQGKVG